jgi:hypothetical protein
VKFEILGPEAVQPDGTAWHVTFLPLLRNQRRYSTRSRSVDRIPRRELGQSAARPSRGVSSRIHVNHTKRELPEPTES